MRPAPKSDAGRDDKLAASLRGMGYTQGAIDQVLAAEADKDEGDGDAVFWLWPENKTSWEFFRFVDRQWRYGAMGGIFGLDLATAVALMPAFNIRDQRAMLEDLKAMEGAALPLLNAKADK